MSQIHYNTFARMLSSDIGFGKYAHLSIAQVLFTDPGWLYWAVEVEGVFSGLRGWAAEEVARRAHRVRITDDYVVDHVFDWRHRFSHLDIVPKDWWPASGYRLPYIDLGMARAYDRLGVRLFVGDVKEHLFGDRSYRLTRRRCLDFFVDTSNFVLPAVA